MASSTTSATPSLATGTNATATGSSKPDYLTRFPKRQGHSPTLITKTLDLQLKTTADTGEPLGVLFFDCQ